MLEWEEIGEGFIAICREDIITISKQRKLWILSSAEKGFVMCFRQLHNAKSYAQGEFGE
jgi:hypothetical protein